MRRERTKLKTVLVLIALIGLFFVVPTTIALKVAHATSCVLGQIDGVATTSNTVLSSHKHTDVFLTTSCNPDYIVGFAYCWQSGGGCAAASSLKDSQSVLTSWYGSLGVYDVPYCYQASCVGTSNFLFYSNATVPLSSDNISVSWNTFGIHTIVGVMAIYGAHVLTDTGCSAGAHDSFSALGAGCNNGYSSTNSLTMTWPIRNKATDLLVGFATSNQTTTFTTSAGFTQQVAWNNAGSGINQASATMQTKLVSTTSAVNAPITSGLSPNLGLWYTWAIPLSVQGVTVTATTACSFFSEQCWVYPLMALGMIDGVFLTVAGVFRTSEKGTLYLLLTGSTFASLVEIQLGIMTPLIPIALIVVVIAYTFRLDRVIAGAVNR